MWFFRQLVRLLWTIFWVTAIAAALACLVALLSSGNLHNDLRVSFLIFGCLMLLFAGAGNQSTASGRRVNWGLGFGLRGGRSILAPPVRPRQGEPTLTMSAIFVGSAVVLLALGLIL